ncbi:MAG: Pyrophosphate--fructose 6-phosphate 1-phosphotransferase [Firmicutes bacterium ADurb.Bin080]|jgi:ATP-dependent phosphofructokinase / diphosphate-dependent phosphofructokinase|nr:6-phosphofructokinase [Clostridiales bacterium]OQC14510.1 MAG: Pyrophosphate--fructose 6-phosphate 1-phosphotransferase [Firmicutes bacterium ADurb.Bin080]
MKNLKGACMFGQSGGPTSVINASAAGVFIEALSQKNITKVYGLAHGIKGLLEENFYDMGKEEEKELLLLKNTPSSNLGSVRYKLKDSSVDETDYKKILEVFKKYDVRYFFYNGGNDSMDTCNKISKYLIKAGYDCNIIGVPKTIDNDLFGTDHCPGYASAAKYIATTLMELNLDAKVYDKGQVVVIEIMGRNAGWLTAAASLAGYKGLGADLIYLPEVPFSVEKFKKDVKRVMDENGGKCIACVSEGIRDKDKNFIVEKLSQEKAKDNFGHTQLGGLAIQLADLISQEYGVKVRGVEFSLMQRSAAHLASGVDVEEAFLAGREAVKVACAGITDKMVAFERDMSSGSYKCVFKLLPLDVVANAEKTVPLEWITEDGIGLKKEFIDYALPLIQGESKAPLEDGLPRFSKLKKIQAGK